MKIKTISIVMKTLIKMEYSKATLYFGNTVLDVFRTVAFIILNLFFWKVIAGMGYKFPGWEFNDLIVFIAYSELFFGLDRVFVIHLSRFWQTIISGELDALLVRPIDPRIRVVLLGIDYFEFFKSFFLFGLLIHFSKAKLSILMMLISLIVLFVGLFIYALIKTSLSCLSFFIKTSEAVNEISDSISLLNKYPADIFPKQILMTIVYFIPIMFFSTFPAQLVKENLDMKYIYIQILAIISNLIIWISLHLIIWKVGLGKYESYNA